MSVLMPDKEDALRFMLFGYMTFLAGLFPLRRP